ncbi:unnamed protein product, partial [Cuscuta europaea]
MNYSPYNTLSARNLGLFFTLRINPSPARHSKAAPTLTAKARLRQPSLRRITVAILLRRRHSSLLCRSMVADIQPFSSHNTVAIFEGYHNRRHSLYGSAKEHEKTNSTSGTDPYPDRLCQGNTKLTNQSDLANNEASRAR